MDIKLGNIKLSLGIIITIVLQAAGLIWYVSSLDSQMNANTAQIEELQAQLERHQEIDAESSADLEERLDDIEQIQKVIDNEIDTEEAQILRESLVHFIRETVTYEVPIKIVVGDRG